MTSAETLLTTDEAPALTKEIEPWLQSMKYLGQRGVCVIEMNKALADKKDALANATSVLEGREIDLNNKRKELETIVEETQKEEEDLLKLVAELEAQIEPRMLNAYRKVRSNLRNKLAVVTVKRDACGGCFNKIPPQRQLDIALSKKIIVCEYCGRILISPEFENEQY